MKITVDGIFFFVITHTHKGWGKGLGGDLEPPPSYISLELFNHLSYIMGMRGRYFKTLKIELVGVS